MNIREYYDKQSQNADWYAKYYQCGKVDDGSIFKFLNTNYRDILTFEYYFNEFLPYRNKPRSNWAVKDTTGQEIAKQYVSGMTETFLYSSQRNAQGELIYDLTSRGFAFKDMLDSKFSNNEKLLLTILFIINASFLKTPRYIAKKSQEVFEHFANAGIPFQKVKADIISFLKIQTDIKVSNIFTNDIVWLTSFFSDENFLKLYNIADETTKANLHEDTKNAYEQSIKTNPLAWKYKNTNFIKSTLVDTLNLLYINICLEEYKNDDATFEIVINRLIIDFSKIYTIDGKKIWDFIGKHYNTFKIIHENIISTDDDFTEKYVAPYRTKEFTGKLPTEKIDTTSKDGIEKLEVIREVLKKLAKEKEKYRCALESLNNCKYFTSKEENKNFLEIHHLVPREFSYYFEDTIEFVENYVPLCPHCHRMIHKAKDRERQGMINTLFNQRVADLKNNKIVITMKDLYEFYKIDEK